jgi:hypothetical protein
VARVEGEAELSLSKVRNSRVICTIHVAFSNSERIGSMSTAILAPEKGIKRGPSVGKTRMTFLSKFREALFLILPRWVSFSFA